MRLHLVRVLELAIVSLGLAACGGGGGGGGGRHSVGGTVTGLVGSGLVLLNNGGDDLAVSANGSFVFATPLANGAPYNVAVRTHPTSPSQTCVVSNGNGSVGKRDVKSVSVACTTLGYTVGGTVSGLKSSGLVLSKNGSDPLAVSTDGTFTFDTPVPVGGAYSIAVKTQPANGAQNCIVMNGTARGTMASANVTSVRVLCADVGRFAYMLNSESSNASGWSIDAATGALAALSGSPFPFPVSSIHPNGKFAYAFGGRVYAINRDTGALAEVAGSPFAGASPSVITPSGRFGYTPRSGGCTSLPGPGAPGPCIPLAGSVSASRIDPNTGSLEAVVGSPFAAGIEPRSASVDASGRFLYVANGGNVHMGGGGNISAYAIDSTTGALAPVTGSPFAARGFPSSVDVAPNGAFVYVVDSGVLLVYRVDAATGVLTPLADRTVMDAGVTAIEIDPSGSFAYGGCADGICAFALDASSGAVTRLPSIAIGDVAMPAMLAFDPSGKFVYGPCGSYACAFAMDSTSGALAAVPGSPLPAGLARRFVAFHPTGKFAYVANTDVSNSVSSFRVDSENGGLTEVAGSPYATLRNPVSIAVDGGGKHVYVLSAPGTRQQPWWVTWFRPTDAPGGISTFAADSSNGGLSLVAGGPVATGLDPVAISVEPGDRFVYVANRMSGSVSGYAIDANTGGLQGLVGSPYYLGSVIPAAPSSLAIEPSGGFMYVPIPQEPAGTAGRPSDSFVSALGINASSGALTAIAGSPFTAGRGSISIAVAPSGKFAYLANLGSGDISAYAIDSATGALASLPGSPYPVGAYPRAIAIEPSGRYAYVLADETEEGNIFAYGIDGLTGALTKGLAMRSTACSSTSMSFDPSGRFAYVPCPAGVWILRFDGNTGALTEVPGNPFAPGTLNPLSVAVTN